MEAAGAPAPATHYPGRKTITRINSERPIHNVLGCHPTRARQPCCSSPILCLLTLDTPPERGIMPVPMSARSDIPVRPSLLVLLLLVLVALSLLSHYVVDALHTSAEACWSCRIQAAEQRGSINENSHATDFHGQCLAGSPVDRKIPKARIFVGEKAALTGLAWEPPAPVRPPISL